MIRGRGGDGAAWSGRVVEVDAELGATKIHAAAKTITGRGRERGRGPAAAQAGNASLTIPRYPAAESVGQRLWR